MSSATIRQVLDVGGGPIASRLAKKRVAKKRLARRRLAESAGGRQKNVWLPEGLQKRLTAALSCADCSQFAIDGEFFGGQGGELAPVAFALRLGDRGAEGALATLKVADAQVFEGEVGFLLGDRLSLVQQNLRQQGTNAALGDGVEWLRGSPIAQAVQGRGDGKAFKMRRIAVERGGNREQDRIVRLRAKGAEKDFFYLADSGGGRGDLIAASGGGLLELFAKDGGVDTELLGGVRGKLVAGQAAGHAADVGQEKVESLDLGFGVVAGE